MLYSKCILEVIFQNSLPEEKIMLKFIRDPHFSSHCFFRTLFIIFSLNLNKLNKVCTVNIIIIVIIITSIHLVINLVFLQFNLCTLINWNRIRRNGFILNEHPFIYFIISSKLV